MSYELTATGATDEVQFLPSGDRKSGFSAGGSGEGRSRQQRLRICPSRVVSDIAKNGIYERLIVAAIGSRCREDAMPCTTSLTIVIYIYRM